MSTEHPQFFLPRGLKGYIEESVWLLICIRIFVLLCVFLLVDQFMIKDMRLPLEAYVGLSPLLNTFSSLNMVGIISALFISFLLVYSGSHTIHWQELDNCWAIKPFVLFLSALMVWFVCTLSFNAYFNNGFIPERIAAVGLLLLLVWRPVFIFPLLVLVYLLFWQTGQPALNNGSHFAHKLQVLHVLNLFAAWLLYKAFIGERKSNDYFFLVACLVAAAYWAPAFKKLIIGWLYQGEVFNMFLNAHAHGWLSFIETEVLVSVVHQLNILDVPVRAFVFAIEAGSLFLLWRRWYSITLLACLIVFHLGVFAMFGYFFWTWIALNAALLLIVFFDRKEQRIAIFTPTHLVLAIVLIATGKYWCNPSPLAWIDGRLTYTYRYEALGESGALYTVPFNFFEPYGDVFTMANFPYLVNQHLMIVNPYGATNRTQADALKVATSAAEVFALEERLGIDKYNPQRTEVFRDFIQEVFASSNTRGVKADALYKGGPPRQFWTQPRGLVFTGQELINTVTVKEVTTLYDGHTVNEIRELTVLSVDVISKPTASQ